MAATEALHFDFSTVKLGNNYLLLGTDAFLVDTVSDGIRRILKKADNADLVIIYGDEVKAAQLNDLLDTYSIFSSAKLVLLRNAEAMEKKELDSLAAYFDSPSDSQSMIIVAEKIDARISGWKKIKDHCQSVVCDPPSYGGMMKQWLTSALQKLGKTMTNNAQTLFLSRVELDYANANNELQKLALLTGDNKQISEAQVLKSIGSSREGTQIDFFRSLGNRQTKQCMELLERMLSSDWEVLQVFYLVTRFYGFVYRILLLKKNHISDSEITSKHLTDVYPSQRQEYVKLASSYSLAGMEKIYSTLIEIDSGIKTSSASNEILLSMGLLKILEKA